MESFLHDISWVVPLRSPVLTLIFEGFTWLGYLPFFLVFLSLGYWLWDKAPVTRLAMLIGVSAILNAFLKDLFHDPRPPLAFAIDARVGESFGLPSGHAQVAAAMWLWLAYEIRRLWALGLALVVVAGVALSRLYLGVHDVEDVLGGALVGLASLVVYRAAVSDQFRFWHDAAIELQLFGIAALAPLLWLVWPDDEVPATVFAIVSFMGFWWLGRTFEAQWVAYRRHDNWLFAGAAAVAGVVILFSLFKFSGDAMKEAGMPGALASSLQFAIISLYVTVIAPAAFRVLRLAR